MRRVAPGWHPAPTVPRATLVFASPDRQLVLLSSPVPAECGRDAVCGRPSRRRPRQIRPGQLTPCAARRPPPPVGASPARTFPPRQGTTGTGALPFRRNQTGPRGPSVSGRPGGGPARWPDVYYFFTSTSLGKPRRARFAAPASGRKKVKQRKYRRRRRVGT